MGKIYGVKVGQEHEYVVKDQREDAEEDQIKFRVMLLGSLEYAEIQNDLYQVHGLGEDRQERIVTGTQVLETLVLGLKGWSNFKYEDGTEVVFKQPSGAVQQVRKTMIENIDKIPPKYRIELAEYIRMESRLGEDKAQPSS